MPTDEEFKIMSEKLDTLTKLYEELKPKEDTEDEVNPLQAKVDAQTEYLREVLAPLFEKDALKDATFEQMQFASKLKRDAKPPLNPAPPLHKTDSEGKTDNRPDFLKATVETA